jgi:hypothetical protein
MPQSYPLTHPQPSTVCFKQTPASSRRGDWQAEAVAVQKPTAYTGPEGLLGSIGRVIRVTLAFNYPAARFPPDHLHRGREPSPSVCDFVHLPATHV